MAAETDPAPRRVMIIGAGATGRGHLGQLAHEAGWELVLVDHNRELIEALRRVGLYTVRLCRADSARTVTVDGYRAYHTDQVEAVVREGLTVPLILTAVFSQNLPHIAPLVARIITARAAAGVVTPLNVICCENMQDSSTVLRDLVLALLDPHQRAYAAERVGFPNCMVSRVVPLPEGNPLALVAEDYNEWTVDAGAFVGPAPELPAMELVPDQETRLARKFFMHNGAHAVCGYWGFHRGHTYIHQAIADPVVSAHVLGAIEELAQVVARRYGLDLGAVRAYGLELGARGAVAEIRDLVSRVVRDPLRKLSRQERLTAPAVWAVEYGLPCDELVLAMAAALHYSAPDDPQSVAMREQLAANGADAALPAILGLPPDHPLVARVAAAYEAWS